MAVLKLLLLVGEPYEFRSFSLGNRVIYEIGYQVKVKEKGYTDLTFTFENGKLESFRQD